MLAGVTADTLARLLKRTILNPVLTLPLVLLARYSHRGRNIATYYKGATKRLRQLLLFGLLLHVSEALDRLVANNWRNDKYDWGKEIVVVTGGSDGIGKIVVQLLAERGIKVCVLDIQPLTYKGTCSSFSYAQCSDTKERTPTWVHSHKLCTSICFVTHVLPNSSPFTSRLSLGPE